MELPDTAHAADTAEAKRRRFEKQLLGTLPLLDRFALYFTRSRDDADDLLQIVREKALRNWQRFEDGTNMRAWLYTIMRNEHFTRARRERRLVRGDVAADAIAHAAAETKDPIDAMTLDQVWNVVATLPAQHRDALLAIFKDALEYEQAARRSGIPVGTMKSRVHRAIKALQQRLRVDTDEA